MKPQPHLSDECRTKFAALRADYIAAQLAHDHGAVVRIGREMVKVKRAAHTAQVYENRARARVGG